MKSSNRYFNYCMATVSGFAALTALAARAEVPAASGVSTEETRPAAEAAGMTASAHDALREQIKREVISELKEQLAAEIKRQVLAELGVGAPAAGAAQAQAETAKPATARVVRVPYVPEAIKQEIREQIKQEVLAQAKQESWGDPGALPGWIGSLKWSGDLRLRAQGEMMGPDNAPEIDYAFANLNAYTTRAPDLGKGSTVVPTSNTQQDRNRVRLRARLGVQAAIGDYFSGGIRLTTGNSTDRVSTNQSLRQNFNKYSLVLDRAYLRFEPNDWLSASGGRMPNPWFGTDLVWDDDVNFEGGAITLADRESRADVLPFLTLGAFPIREDNPPTRDDRWLYGGQAGLQWNLNTKTRFKVGLGYYDYRNLEGKPEQASSFSGVCPGSCDLIDPAYGRYEYESGLRQKGNTLFSTAYGLAPDNATNPLWGLASRFEEVNLTASLDLGHWDPVHAILTADYVKNIGYDRNEIFRRTGLTAANIPDGKSEGYLLKLQLGWPEVRERHEWNAFVAYRHLGSDAVLDAFTDSDFGLGGTNLEGYQFGVNYGIDRNVSLGLKWMSADAIDSMIPDTTFGGNSAAKFGVDLLQIDLSARF